MADPTNPFQDRGEVQRAIADEADSAARRADFHNRLRMLVNIDREEFDPGWGHTDADWMAFRENPWRFFILADDNVAAHIWAVMESRAQARAVEPPITAPHPSADCPACQGRVENLPGAAFVCNACGFDFIPF